MTAASMVHADPSVSSETPSVSRVATLFKEPPQLRPVPSIVPYQSSFTPFALVSIVSAHLSLISSTSSGFSIILPFNLFQSLLPCHRALIVPSRTRGRAQVAAPSSESSPLQLPSAHLLVTPTSTLQPPSREPSHWQSQAPRTPHNSSNVK